MTDEEMQEMMRKGKVLQEIGHYAEALFYYRHAASLGNSDAMMELGWMRLAGQGLFPDEGKAFKWFRKAANAGNVSGMIAVAVAYRFGYGISPDCERVVHWYRKAAEAGNGDIVVDFCRAVTVRAVFCFPEDGNCQLVDEGLDLRRMICAVLPIL